MQSKIPSIRIGLMQFGPRVGDMHWNTERIREEFARFAAAGCDLVITPELGLCGYAMGDLIERPEFIQMIDQCLIELAHETKGKQTALAVGHVSLSSLPEGRAYQNKVSVLLGGQIVFTQAKSLIPHYNVFDEARYFEPAREIRAWDFKGHRIGFAICEDLWFEEMATPRRYPSNPVDKYSELGLSLLCSLSSSPFDQKKRFTREVLHQKVVERLNVPLVYVNQSGAVDEILFDGGSFFIEHPSLDIIRCPYFEDAAPIVEVGSGNQKLAPSDIQCESEISIIYRGLVLGIREYFVRTGFEKALIGLSGGIDSAVVAVLASKALGAKNVLGISMPSQFSSAHSITDAEKLAHSLKIRFEVKPIKFSYSTLSRELSEARTPLAPIALENLQARLRGIILMTLANHESSLVLSPGNKSEIAMGYCTLYGDMVGALTPIGDLFKTQVYELARFMNTSLGHPIPQNTIEKVPSAELRPNQTDQDSLPPYDLLDSLLKDWIEEGMSLSNLQKKYENQEIDVQKVLRQVDANDYKRRQGSPILRVSGRAFGVGRRIPLAKKW